MPLHSSPQSGHVIQDETTPLTARAALNFTGAGVTATDNAGTGATDVSISGAGVSDASTSVKGVTKVSVAPVSASLPIAVGDNDKRVQPQVSGTAAGNLGTAQTVDFTSVAQEIWLIGVLNGNLAVTVSNPVAGSRLKVIAPQDATGSRTLTVAGQAITIPPGASGSATPGVAMVTVDWVDATNFRVESAGVYTESDPLAILKSLVDAAGDLIVGSADNTVVRLAKGGSGTALTVDSTGALAWGGPATLTANAQTGTSYTLVLADAGKLVTVSNAATHTLTVPTNASVAFPVGTVVNVARIGAGAVNLAAAGGVTVNSPGAVLGLRAQYSQATLVKTATDTWLLGGDIA
jgi:hypothetical protein